MKTKLTTLAVIAFFALTFIVIWHYAPDKPDNSIGFVILSAGNNDVASNKHIDCDSLRKDVQKSIAYYHQHANIEPIVLPISECDIVSGEPLVFCTNVLAPDIFRNAVNNIFTGKLYGEYLGMCYFCWDIIYEIGDSFPDTTSDVSFTESKLLSIEIDTSSNPNGCDWCNDTIPGYKHSEHSKIDKP